MKTDFTVLSSFRNRDTVNNFVAELRNRGFTCHNFCDVPADPNNPHGDPEEQQQAFESVTDFYNEPHFAKVFNEDLQALKNANKVILLQPCGLSAHMEAGIAFGMNKPLIMIGEPVKPESLYLIFQERYQTSSEFFATLPQKQPMKQSK